MHIWIQGEAGVMAELQKSCKKNTEVEVLPVVDLLGELPKFSIANFVVGDATQVENSCILPLLYYVH